MVTLRPLDPAHDLDHVAAVVGRVRANGGSWHPGGIQWWLRELDRPGFEAFIGEVDGPDAFVAIDDAFAIVVADDPPRRTLELTEWAEVDCEIAVNRRSRPTWSKVIQCIWAWRSAAMHRARWSSS